MFLPNHILTCIDTLESAGFATYAVGGCVRDSLLGLVPHDYDLCTAATPAQLRDVFSGYPLVLAGEKHGTVSVVFDKELVEITTFRTEGGYQDSRHPDWVRFVTDIESDLSRRDFTINAMAYSPHRGLIDPFGGREDLKIRILRAVGNPQVRFTEDALRILRGIRFSVRYHLHMAQETKAAMLALAPQLDMLAKERIFEELCKLLPLITADDLGRFAPVFAQVIPELQATLNFNQHSVHHAYDLFTHTAQVVQAVPPKLSLRLAALLHDIGKPVTFYLDESGNGHFPDHAKIGAQMADSVLLRLKAPTALRNRVVGLIAQHMTLLQPDKRLLRRHLGKHGISDTLALLALQRADFSSKGTKETSDLFDRVAELLEQIQAEDLCLTTRDLAVNGHDLLQLGYAPGPQIGRCLEHLLDAVQSDRLPNKKDALLQVAQSFLS